MDLARASLRALLLALATLLLLPVLVLGQLLVRVLPALGRRLHQGTIRLWARTALRITGTRVRVEGEVPAPPFFLVANHLSYVDILVLHATVRGTFLAKSEIAGWPVLGWLARLAGTQFVERERRRDLSRVGNALSQLLERGEGVIVFPESTSTQGAQVLDFKPALFQVAIGSDRPVLAASLAYRTPPGAPPAHLSVCWWGDMDFGPHFWRFLMLPRVEASLAFGDVQLRDTDRKRLAQRAREAVLARFTPSVIA